MMYTKADLTVMQGWPLERKIQVTQTKLIEFYLHYKGRVCISFSGGIDSTVLLDLARRIYPDIPAAFVDTGLEYPEIRAFVKGYENVAWLRPQIPFNRVIQEYGYPVISKEVARRIYYARKGSDWAIRHLQGVMKDGTPSKFNARYVKWAYLLDASFPISDYCCEVMKKRPIKKYQREHGYAAILGTMAYESAQRQSAYLKNGCNAFHAGRSQPLSFWTQQDVLHYLLMTRLPYASIYGDIVMDKKGRLTTTGAKRTGCMFCMFGIHLEKQPNRFQRIEFTHPKQHDYCIHKLGCGAVMDFIGVPYSGYEGVKLFEV